MGDDVGCIAEITMEKILLLSIIGSNRDGIASGMKQWKKPIDHPLWQTWDEVQRMSLLCREM